MERGIDGQKLPSYLKSPYVWVLIVAALSGVLYFSAPNVNKIPGISVNQPEFRYWTRGLTITLIGSYLVAILVDRTHRELQRKERERVRNVALEQLTGPINRQLSLLGSWYVASLESEPEEKPDSFRELLEGDYYDTVKWLDFSNEYSIAQGGANFFDVSGQYFQKSNNEIENVISKYAAFMDSDMVSKLQSLSDSTLTGVMISLADSNVVRMDQQRSIQRDYTMLVGQNMDEATEEHISLILDVISYYESENSPDLTPIEDAGLWRDDTSPKIGDGRSKVPPRKANPKFGAGPGAPPKDGVRTVED